MRLIDISVPISAALAVWPGDPPVALERASSIDRGDECNVTMIRMGAHTGTHLDAPLHFLADGPPVDSIPAGTLIGPCRVIELAAHPLIERRDIERHDLGGQSRILFKTGNSLLWDEHPAEFRRDYVSLGLDAARYLVETGVRLVGIDYLSIESFEAPDHPVHRLLLRNNIAILEGINLAAAGPGDYELICLPLKIRGAEGAPARAFLREI